MPNFTAEGFRVPATSDNYALTNDLRKMMESAKTIVPVANKTARTALIAALTADGRPPTPTNPTIVVRADAAGDPIEITEDGTTWTARPSVFTVGGYGPDTGYAPPPGTRTVTRMFNVIAATSGTGTISVTFPDGGFSSPPIINGMVTITGADINPVVFGGYLAATGVDIYFPGVFGVTVRVHITATGWVAE